MTSVSTGLISLSSESVAKKLHWRAEYSFIQKPAQPEAPGPSKRPFRTPHPPGRVVANNRQSNAAAVPSAIVVRCREANNSGPAGARNMVPALTSATPYLSIHPAAVRLVPRSRGNVLAAATSKQQKALERLRPAAAICYGSDDTVNR